MLQAILLNKAGRSISSNEVHWKQLFTASEDSLTSTVFGALLHLPRKLFWQLLHNSCYSSALPGTINNILAIEYWPHWDPENSTNINFVEPDIFIRTDTCDLIIEAKRYDYNQQSKSQWENEFHAYLNQYGEDNRNVFLIALGGINNEKNEILEVKGRQLNIIKLRWGRILNETKRLTHELENGNLTLECKDSVLTILEDLILGFRIHGYATGEWFQHTKFHNHTISNQSLKFLLNMRTTFKSNRFGHIDSSRYNIKDQSIQTLLN